MGTVPCNRYPGIYSNKEHILQIFQKIPTVKISLFILLNWKTAVKIKTKQHSKEETNKVEQTNA